jgi:hypothetical protein
MQTSVDVETAPVLPGAVLRVGLSDAFSASLLLFYCNSSSALCSSAPLLPCNVFDAYALLNRR